MRYNVGSEPSFSRSITRPPLMGSRSTLAALRSAIRSPSSWDPDSQAAQVTGVAPRRKKPVGGGK
jgi:hypothetical protein